VERLEGRYEYVRELGRGGAGRVVLARDVADGSSRALKIVPPDALGTLELELSLLRRVAHPSLARVVELLRVSAPLGEPFRLPTGTAVLVQELVEGERSDVAFAALERGSHERLRLVLHVAAELLSALATLHAAGLVHGDVSPANVVVRSSVASTSARRKVRYDASLAVLIDLGLAGPPLAADGLARGTRGFLAPEAAVGARTQSTDLYALGACVHHWLGGTVAEHVDVETLPATTPAAWVGWIEDLVASSPEDRLRSAAAALEALSGAARAIGEELPVLTAPRAVVEPTFVGAYEHVEVATQTLIAGGLLRIGGPPESGKSRFAREVALALQASARREGRRVPTFVRARASSELSALDAPCAVVHVEGVDEAEARRAARADSLGGCERFWIVEDADDADVVLGPLDEVDFARLVHELDPGIDVDALRARSGGLAGRAVRLARAERESRALDDHGISRTHEPRPSREVPQALERTRDEAWLDVAGGELPIQVLDAPHTLVRAGLAFVREERVILRPDRRGHLDDSTRGARAQEVIARCTEAGVWDAHLARAIGDETRARRMFATHARRALDEGRVEDALVCAREADDVTRVEIGSKALGRLARYAEALELADAPSTNESSPSKSAARDAARRAELARRAGLTERARDEAWRAGDEGAETLAWIALGAGELETAAELARSPELRAWVALSSGRLDEADAIVSSALARSEPRTADAREARARCLIAAGSIAQAKGALDEARVRHAEAFRIARAIGDVHLAATAAANEGIVALDAGELGHGRRALREAARRYAIIGRARDLGRALLNLASAALWVGDDEGAAWHAEQARAASNDARDALGLAYVALVELELALRRGALERAVDRAHEVESGDVRARARAAALLAGTHVTLARALLASRGAEEQSFDVTLARARIALGEGDVTGATEARAALSARTWEEQLLLARFDHELALARHEPAHEALGRLRSLLDRASRGLEVDQRRHLRRHPAFASAWAARPASAVVVDEVERWRDLAAFAARTMDDDERTVVDEALRRAREVLDAERAFVVARAEDGALVVAGRATLAHADAGAAPSRTAVARALANGALVTTVDALGDEEWGRAQSVHALALRSVACAPLPRSGLALYVDDRARPSAFAPHDLAYLEALAATVDAALVQARARSDQRRARERDEKLRADLEARLARADEELRARRTDDERLGLVTRSPAMRRFVELLARVAPTESTVLLRGETGSGKERVARAIHDASARASGPFVAESCAALPDALLESALFGHVRGAFTGATDRRRGLFELAHGGTLLLDEIAETSPAMQAKLLRVLQEGEVRPLGAERTVKVDVRVIAATHRDLRERVRGGSFREDLYYRLAVLELVVPSLRERADDVPGIVRSLLARRGTTRRVPAETLAWLASRAWPGNVRELESALERALLATEDELRPEHFGQAEEDAPELRDAVDELERKLVVEALEATGGNRTHAAARLGLSRVGLRKKMKRLGIA
jgi:transcriptional regulator with GAF, ATPase, and Fis domain